MCFYTHPHSRRMVTCGHVGCVAQHPTWHLLIPLQAILFRIFPDFGPIFVLLFGCLSKLIFLCIWCHWKSLDVQLPQALTQFDLELQLQRYHIWKRGNTMQEIMQQFSWKIHFFQFVANIFEPSLWKIFETSKFNLVQIDCSNCCSVGTVFCAKTAPKTTLFDMKIVKYLIRVLEFY